MDSKCVFCNMYCIVYILSFSLIGILQSFILPNAVSPLSKSIKTHKNKTRNPGKRDSRVPRTSFNKWLVVSPVSSYNLIEIAGMRAMRLSALETGRGEATEIADEIGNKIDRARRVSNTENSWAISLRKGQSPFAAIVRRRDFSTHFDLSVRPARFSRRVAEFFAFYLLLLLLLLFGSSDRNARLVALLTREVGGRTGTWLDKNMLRRADEIRRFRCVRSAETVKRARWRWLVVVARFDETKIVRFCSPRPTANYGRGPRRRSRKRRCTKHRVHFSASWKISWREFRLSLAESPTWEIRFIRK